jgi:hypothetical protein
VLCLSCLFLAMPPSERQHETSSTPVKVFVVDSFELQAAAKSAIAGRISAGVDK